MSINSTMVRKGLGRHLGKGYKNLVLRDPYIHSLSAKGVKQKTFSQNMSKGWRSFKKDWDSTKIVSTMPDFLRAEDKEKTKKDDNEASMFVQVSSVVGAMFGFGVIRALGYGVVGFIGTAGGLVLGAVTSKGLEKGIGYVKKRRQMSKDTGKPFTLWAKGRRRIQ